jgi:outer membrane protein assembly factor BamB
VGSSSGPSGSATWKTNQAINNGFAWATWDAGTHYVATDPWDNAGNAVACAPPTQTNTCLTFRLTRPDWPQYRQNARHTGFNPFETSITTRNAGRLKRRCTFANSGIVSPASVYDQVAYVGSTDGKVYAIDSHCKQKWAFKTGGPVVSTPDVTDDVVYVGSSDGSIYALRMSTGALLWRTQTGGKVQSSPVLSNGVVYVGSSDHRLYAINFTNGSVLWSYLTGGSNDVLSRRRPVSGVRRLWRRQGVRDNDGRRAQVELRDWRSCEVIPGDSWRAGVCRLRGQELYALGELTGTKIWSFATEGKIDSSPAVSGRLVFVGSADKKLYAVGTQVGHKVWARSTGRSITSDPGCREWSALYRHARQFCA